MKRNLGYILLFLLGLSGCQESIATPAMETTIITPATVTTSLQQTALSTNTPTAISATSTPLQSVAIVPTIPIATSVSASPIPTSDLSQEIEIYRRSYCGTCHTLTVAETTGTFGPTQDHISTTAAQRIQDPSYTGSAVTVEEYLLESLVDPRAYIVSGYALSRHQMPPFTHLDEKDLQAIVRLLLAQK